LLNDEIKDLHDSVLNNSGTPALQAWAEVPERRCGFSAQD